MALSDQQVETFIYQFRTQIQTLITQQTAQNATLNQLQTSLNSLQATPTTTVVSSGAAVGDTYFSAGGILHKLVTTFQAAVSFGATLAVTGIATFTAAPVFSSVTASQVLMATAGKALTSGLVSLTTMVTGVLPTTNGGTGSSNSTFAVLVAEIQTVLSAAITTNNLSDISNVALARSNIGAASNSVFAGATIALAKLTPTGSNGSLTVNVAGQITAYTAPT